MTLQKDRVWDLDFQCRSGLFHWFCIVSGLSTSILDILTTIIYNYLFFNVMGVGTEDPSIGQRTYERIVEVFRLDQ